MSSNRRKSGVPPEVAEGVAWKVGDRVVVTRGPLEGKDGIVVEDRQARVILSVRLVSRKVMVEMDREWIKLALPKR